MKDIKDEFAYVIAANSKREHDGYKQPVEPVEKLQAPGRANHPPSALALICQLMEELILNRTHAHIKITPTEYEDDSVTLSLEPSNEVPLSDTLAQFDQEFMEKFIRYMLANFTKGDFSEDVTILPIERKIEADTKLDLLEFIGKLVYAHQMCTPGQVQVDNEATPEDLNDFVVEALSEGRKLENDDLGPGMMALFEKMPCAPYANLSHYHMQMYLTQQTHLSISLPHIESCLRLEMGLPKISEDLLPSGYN